MGPYKVAPSVDFVLAIVWWCISSGKSLFGGYRDQYVRFRKRLGSLELVADLPPLKLP